MQHLAHHVALQQQRIGVARAVDNPLRQEGVSFDLLA